MPEGASRWGSRSRLPKSVFFDRKNTKVPKEQRKESSKIQGGEKKESARMPECQRVPMGGGQDPGCRGVFSLIGENTKLPKEQRRESSKIQGVLEDGEKKKVRECQGARMCQE